MTMAFRRFNPGKPAPTHAVWTRPHVGKVKVTIVTPGATSTVVRDEYGYVHTVSNTKLKAVKGDG
jgi:hypothetical protein